MFLVFIDWVGISQEGAEILDNFSICICTHLPGLGTGPLEGVTNQKWPQVLTNLSAAVLNLPKAVTLICFPVLW